MSPFHSPLPIPRLWGQTTSSTLQPSEIQPEFPPTPQPSERLHLRTFNPQRNAQPGFRVLTWGMSRRGRESEHLYFYSLQSRKTCQVTWRKFPPLLQGQFQEPKHKVKTNYPLRDIQTGRWVGRVTRNSAERGSGFLTAADS